MDFSAVTSGSWGQYIPAELTIKTESAELETDMSGVYDDMDLKRPYSLMKEFNQKTQAELLELIAAKAREGDRMANIASGEKNVFGAIAHERYMRSGQKELNVGLVPHQGVIIDFRIHPPEINFEVRGGLPK
ncbi:DUF6470 family protein [Paenibacillus caui]|uniref:DUF6470 family protein n=1 Tax=Paenibacillus caui TaxID=2873927 RepID=UPI001CA8B829|nr:DUF6470 family protein [Paenibacillus caui]